MSDYSRSHSVGVSEGDPFKTEPGDEHLTQLRALDAGLASVLDLKTCLRPEMALILELYEAQKAGRAVTVSVLGLLDGIAPTTTLRYLELLQSKGVVRRVAHESDNRMTYVELTEAARAAIDAALVA